MRKVIKVLLLFMAFIGVFTISACKKDVEYQLTIQAGNFITVNVRDSATQSTGLITVKEGASPLVEIMADEFYTVRDVVVKVDGTVVDTVYSPAQGSDNADKLSFTLNAVKKDTTIETTAAVKISSSLTVKLTGLAAEGEMKQYVQGLKVQFEDNPILKISSLASGVTYNYDYETAHETGGTKLKLFYDYYAFASGTYFIYKYNGTEVYGIYTEDADIVVCEAKISSSEIVIDCSSLSFNEEIKVFQAETLSSATTPNVFNKKYHEPYEFSITKTDPQEQFDYSGMKVYYNIIDEDHCLTPIGETYAVPAFISPATYSNISAIYIFVCGIMPKATESSVVLTVEKTLPLKLNPVIESSYLADYSRNESGESYTYVKNTGRGGFNVSPGIIEARFKNLSIKINGGDNITLDENNFVTDYENMTVVFGAETISISYSLDKNLVIQLVAVEYI